ncbi:MAG: VCBS repeat-containing protein [Candidatus Sumerlaeaceae bacterium]|nr:VCBS repeat-containing protein [Candidatus Sumerlaeaceae bacterium]
MKCQGLWGILSAALLLAFAPASAGAVAVQIEGTSRTLEIRGKETGEYFGRPLLCVDLDSDGYQDIVVGADRSSFVSPQRPTLYVFKGKRNYASTDLIDLSSAQPDAVILGDTGSDELATALAAGDVNKDGFKDLVAADSTMAASGRTGAGIVYVLFGGPSFFSQTVYDLALNQWSVKILGAVAGDDTGGYLLFGGLQSKGLACGDINNDGIDDIAVGAHLADVNSRTDAGKVLVVYGRTPFTPGTTIDLLSQASSTILGNETFAELGTAIAIGDLNADGIADLIMGEDQGSVGSLTTEGKVFVLWGSSSFPASYNLLSTAANLTILGGHVWDELGHCVAMADINGDTKRDLVVTAPGWDPAGVSSADWGAVYAFLGKTTWPATINLASASPDLFIAAGDTTNTIGDTLAVGDFNKDSRADFMFSARDGERPIFSNEGRTYVVGGRASFPGTLSLTQGSEQVEYIVNGATNNLQLGDTIATGDIDGDGAVELLLAAPFVNSSTGKLLIFDITPVPAAAAEWQLYE